MPDASATQCDEKIQTPWSSMRWVRHLGQAGPAVFVRGLGQRQRSICNTPRQITGTGNNLLLRIGTDISFDLELIRKFGVQVHAFDPTPRSLAWLKTQNVPAGFHAHQYGVAERTVCSGLLRQNRQRTFRTQLCSAAGSERSIWAPVRRVATIMKDLGHDSLDILKMDVEGAEYADAP